jgi:hypothetical protein
MHRNSVSSSASADDEYEAGADDFARSRAPPSAAAKKVLEASACSVRWEWDHEGEKGAP